MSQCSGKHVKLVNKRPVKVPCYYIAGECISNPMNQGGYESFLRANYPYHHGATYSESKRAHQMPVPAHPEKLT